MNLTRFENFNARMISLSEAKRILDRSDNAYVEDEIKKIVDSLNVLAELAAEHVQETMSQRHQTFVVQQTSLANR